MTKKRCEEVFDNGALVSRCVGEVGHGDHHYYPNRHMKKEYPKRFEELQKRKTPYLIITKELLYFDSDY
jgi:hypothetical protein